MGSEKASLPEVELTTLELDVLGGDAVHAPLMAAVHTNLVRFYGLSGLGLLGVSALIPLLCQTFHPSGLTALQLALMSAGVLLAGAAALRSSAKRRLRHLRGEVLSYCERHGTTLGALELASRRLGVKWRFFGVVCGGAEQGSEEGDET